MTKKELALVKVVAELIDLLINEGVGLGELRDIFINSGMSAKETDMFLEQFEEQEKNSIGWFVGEGK